MRFAELEAVTIDGFGTLLELESPIDGLRSALEARGVERSATEVARAFAAEARHYRATSHLAANDELLARFREQCVRVFLDALAADLEAREFVDAFLSALVFRPADGAEDALAALQRHGLRLAVVSNWDCSLPARLEALDLHLHFDAVVTSADARAPKPEPRPLQIALELLGADANRSLHIGDEESDVLAAHAAGMHFAPAPLSTAVAALA